MADPIDTLLTQVAKWLAVYEGNAWSTLNDEERSAYKTEDAQRFIDCVFKPAAASGEQRCALLTALGYEVREWFEFEESPAWVTHNGKNVPASLHLYAEESWDWQTPVLVLRDQRETTDG